VAAESFRNLILRYLDRDAVERLQLHKVRLEQAQPLEKLGAPIQEMFFIEEGLGSMTTCFADGSQVESGIFGLESAIGAAALMGRQKSMNNIAVQMAGSAWVTTIALAHREFRRRELFHDLVLRYVQSQVLQAAQAAGCNARHNVQQRLSRWLLACRDRVTTDLLALTQEFLAMMLGVERPAVSVVAGKLQNRGLIEYSRGRVRILDRPGLEALACECYQVLGREKEEFIRFGQALSTSPALHNGS
jgi:CRP-like cAMP-binding protein